MSKLHALMVVVGALLIGAIFANSASVNAATITVQVGQTNGGTTSANQFNAASITITAGDTVSFARFAGSHDATSWVKPAAASAFASPSPMATGSTFNVTLTVTGTYTYYCTIHANDTEADLAVVDANIANGKMVGKIVVNAPAPDTTPPTVSGVSASPNPTNGSGSVALSATVGDNIGVTSAQYRIDGGTPAAMSVAGTSASATIATGGLSIATHTIEVQSRDAANNVSAWVALTGGLQVTGVPAGAVTASVTVNGGSLTNTTSPVGLGTITLNGTDQLASGSPATPWNAADARGSGAGWNVTVTASDFSSSAGTIPVANFKMRLTTVATVSGNAPPVAPVGSFTALSSASPLKILSAAANTGMGSYNYSPDLQLTVPASTKPGSYSSNMTVTIASGP